MKFLIDNQLPAAPSRFLISLDCDCVHVIEAGLAEASDIEIWRFACERNRIVISKDEDFLHLASKGAGNGGIHMGASGKFPHSRPDRGIPTALAPHPGFSRCRRAYYRAPLTQLWEMV